MRFRFVGHRRALTNGAWSAEGVVEMERINRGDYEDVTVRDGVPVDTASQRFLRLNVHQSP